MYCLNSCIRDKQDHAVTFNNVVFLFLFFLLHQYGLGAVLSATKASAALPQAGDEYDFYRSFPGFQDFCESQGDKLLLWWVEMCSDFYPLADSLHSDMTKLWVSEFFASLKLKCENLNLKWPFHHVCCFLKWAPLILRGCVRCLRRATQKCPNPTVSSVSHYEFLTSQQYIDFIPI